MTQCVRWAFDADLVRSNVLEILQEIAKDYTFTLTVSLVSAHPTLLTEEDPT